MILNGNIEKELPSSQLYSFIVIQKDFNSLSIFQQVFINLSN